MKKIKLFLCLLLTCPSLFSMAQDSARYNPHGLFIYGDIGGGYGTHGSFKMTMNVIDKKDNVFSLAYCFSSHRDPKMPADFHPGLFGLYPQQTLSMVGLMYGKAYSRSSSVVRFIVRGGLSFGVASTPDNYQLSGGWFDSNYDYGSRKEFCAGIILNPTMELPLGRKAGLSLGFYGNINYVSPVFGLEGTMIFGKLRNRTVREQHRHNARMARKASEQVDK